MVLPRCIFTLRGAIGVAIFFVVLITERGTVEATSETQNTSSSTSTTPAVSNPPTSPTVSASTSENEAELPIPHADNFTKECRRGLTNYVFTAIVAHNMNRDQAKALHYKNRDFNEIARNLTNTIISFADQLGKMMYMFNVCTESPIDLVAPSEEVPEHSSSDTTILLLLFVILVLSSYIGYLTYQIRTNSCQPKDVSLKLEKILTEGVGRSKKI